MCLSLTRDNSKIVKIHNLLGQFQPTLAQSIPKSGGFKFVHIDLRGDIVK